MAVDAKGRLWLGIFGGGVWMFDGKKGFPVGSPDTASPGNRISRIVPDGNRMWAVTAGDGLWQFDLETGGWRPFTPSPGKDMAYLHGFLDLGEDELLLGSVGSGAAWLNQGTWRPIGQKEGLTDSWVNDIVPASPGAWLGTSGGIFLFRDGSIREWRYPTDEGGPGGLWVNPEVNVLIPRDPFLFVGTGEDGVFFFPPSGQEKKVQGTFGNIQAFTVWHGDLWAAGPSALFRISSGRPGEWSARTVAEAPRERGWKSLAVSSDDRLLIGTMDGKVFASVDGEEPRCWLEYIDGKGVFPVGDVSSPGNDPTGRGPGEK